MFVARGEFWPLGLNVHPVVLVLYKKGGQTDSNYFSTPEGQHHTWESTSPLKVNFGPTKK
jgi:hypothetical protein